MVRGKGAGGKKRNISRCHDRVCRQKAGRGRGGNPVKVAAPGKKSTVTWGGGRSR